MISDLDFVSPESCGIPSENILKFIEILEYNKINIHSFMMARGGKIFAEAYVKPFDEHFLHRLYSSSKTVVALAVGKLITEGKLHYDDRLADIFRDFIEIELDEYQKEATVLDALTMTLPYMPGSKDTKELRDTWTADCFNRTRGIRPSGAFFTYGDGANLLAVAVELITGKSFVEYLRPEFDKIGVSRDIWCAKDPEGYAWGGSAVICNLRDFAAIGEFVMNKGAVGGEQLISREYMERATSMQIDNLHKPNYSPYKTEGYGYLTWITKEGFAMRGAACQNVFCFPEKNLLFACQADTWASGVGGDAPHNDILYQAFKFLVYDCAGEALPEGESTKILAERLKCINPPSFGAAHSDFEREINGVTYILDENPMGWKYFKLDFSGDEGTLTYENARGVKKISFGCGYRMRGSFPETHYYDKQKGVPAGRGLDTLSVAEWRLDNVLLLRVNLIDTGFGSIFFHFTFVGDRVALNADRMAEFALNDYHGLCGGARLT